METSPREPLSHQLTPLAGIVTQIEPRVHCRTQLLAGQIPKELLGTWAKFGGSMLDSMGLF
jgi:hypothetical protein